MFDFVADLAGRPAYTDHFLDDYRLARVNPVGEGAAARFRLKAPMASRVRRARDRARRPAAADRRGAARGPPRAQPLGRRLRLHAGGSRPHARGAHHLQRAGHAVDRFREIGAAWWMRRQTKKALERLRAIFEEPRTRAAQAGDDRRLRGREGGALRRAHRHGPGAARPVRAPNRLPRPMVLRRAMIAAACVLALASGGLAAAAAETRSRAWTSRPARAWPSSSTGVEYNVFITRQLNPAIPPDKRLLRRVRRPDRDETLYGVFIQACNRTDEDADHRRLLQGQGQPGQRVRADRRCPRTTRSPTTPPRCCPTSASPRRAASPSSGPAAALDAAVQAAARDHREPAARARDRGRGPDEQLTYELDI